MKRNPRDLVRYNASERANHWVVGICFILLALSGLAFFHPAFFWLTNLFGGGPWTRILHPYIGVVMGAFFVIMACRFAKLNIVEPRDIEWLKNVNKMIDGDDHDMPEQGKYNGGQKLIFWIMVGSLFVLLVSGFMFWSPWFVDYFPITLRRIAVLLHAASAVVLVLSVIVHVYAAIWVKGTMQAMTRGTVSDGWARQNHALWHQEVTGGKPQ